MSTWARLPAAAARLVDLLLNQIHVTRLACLAACNAQQRSVCMCERNDTPETETGAPRMVSAKSISTYTCGGGWLAGGDRSFSFPFWRWFLQPHAHLRLPMASPVGAVLF